MARLAPAQLVDQRSNSRELLRLKTRQEKRLRWQGGLYVRRRSPQVQSAEVDEDGNAE